MILNFFKPIKKYIPRSVAVKKLKLTNKQFDELVVLCSIYPILPINRSSIHFSKIQSSRGDNNSRGGNTIDNTRDNTRDNRGEEDGWYYKIDDIRKIYLSEVYDVLHFNRKNREKRENHLKFNRTDRLLSFRDEEVGLVSLVKQRYSSFGDALAALGTAITNLYLIQAFSPVVDASANQNSADEKPANQNSADEKSTNQKSTNQKSTNQKSAETLENFENFLTKNGILERAFLSKKGVYFSFDCEKIRLVWLHPYPGENLENFVEERREAERKIRTECLVFLEDFGESCESTEEESTEAPAEEKKEDISLLRYAEPLLATHVELALFKYRSLYGEGRRREGIFRGRKVCISIESVRRQLEIVLRSEEAEIVGEETAEIVYTAAAERVCAGVAYCHPQHVFDSLNKKVFLSPEPYFLGKELPPHLSPFQDPYEIFDGRAVQALSNKKKNLIYDKFEKLN